MCDPSVLSFIFPSWPL